MKNPKVKRIGFYKENGQWFADLPDWTGEQWELEMVDGADKMLDIYSQGKSTIYLTLSAEPLTNSDIIRFEKYEKDGAWYTTNKLNNMSYPGFRLWLCHVTKFVFGSFPNEIYIR